MGLGLAAQVARPFFWPFFSQRDDAARCRARGRSSACVTMAAFLACYDAAWILRDIEFSMATLYDTLGVPAHATDEEIKRAYRKAAMKWHPDRNHGAEETARAAFQEIKDAYAILSNAEQR